mmetsp:Transcript_27237/g.62148  ORF Transcript_27237/g.62148 Transcript_27237/m.62148 type:complete len:312 (-) Transcript_27237:194-1129(-)
MHPLCRAVLERMLAGMVCAVRHKRAPVDEVLARPIPSGRERAPGSCVGHGRRAGRRRRVVEVVVSLRDLRCLGEVVRVHVVWRERRAILVERVVLAAHPVGPEDEGEVELDDAEDDLDEERERGREQRHDREGCALQEIDDLGEQQQQRKQVIAQPDEAEAHAAHHQHEPPPHHVHNDHGRHPLEAAETRLGPEGHREEPRHESQEDGLEADMRYTYSIRRRPDGRAAAASGLGAAPTAHTRAAAPFVWHQPPPAREQLFRVDESEVPPPASRLQRSALGSAASPGPEHRHEALAPALLVFLEERAVVVFM